MGNKDDSYRNMWEQWGLVKKDIYLNYKFKPTHRIGLTNFVREKVLLSCVKNWDGLSVLDVGCAAGSQLYTLSPRINEGVGVDIAQSLIDGAIEYTNEKGFKNLSFLRADAENLPFPNERFDVVICGEVLEHVFDKDIVLTELLRVIKPGGYLLISIPNLNADGTWWGRFLRLIRVRTFTPIEVFSKEEIASHGDAHVREYDASGALSWFRGYPITVRRLTSASYLDGPFVDVLMRALLKLKIIRNFFIYIELLLSNTNVVWGRHIVISLQKDKLL